MRVKLAAKMLIIAWTLMKIKIDFNPDFLLTADDSTLHFRTHFGLKMAAEINNSNNINK